MSDAVHIRNRTTERLRSSFTNWTLAAVVIFSAITPLLLMVAPAVASQLGLQMHLTPAQIGIYFFAELGAMSFATVPSFWWMGRYDVRLVAAFGIGIFILGNIASATLILPFQQLVFLRILTAFGGGTVMVICVTSAAKSENRDRVYALWVIGQLIAGAIGLAVLPKLFALYGIKSLYVSVAIGAVVASPLAMGFQKQFGGIKRNLATSDSVIPNSSRKGQLRVSAAAVLAVLSFYIAVGGSWTFASQAGASGGLTPSRIGEILAQATLFGIVGAALASFAGGRYRRLLMLAVGFFALFTSLVGFSLNDAFIFMVASYVFKLSWTFALPFMLASAARHDVNGRLMSCVNLTIGAGLAVGPLIAGFILNIGAPLSMIFYAAASLTCVSLGIMYYVERAKA